MRAFTLFLFNYCPSSSTVFAFDKIRLALIYDVPTLDTYASAC